MKGVAARYIESFSNDHARRRRFIALLGVLAFLVAFLVVWQLKITGISMAGDANVSDSNADVETAAQWEKTLPTLSDDWPENVAAIALSQVGYEESSKNFIMADDGETRQGYTRYGAWYGSEYNDWDAMFASFCLEYAGVPKKEFPQSIGAYAWVSNLKKAELYKKAGSYEPKAGDVVFFKEDGDRANGVGVVTKVADNGKLMVIRGDCDNKVKKIAYDAKDGSIVGFGCVPQNPAVTERLEAEATAKMEAEAAKAGDKEATDAKAEKATETGEADDEGEEKAAASDDAAGGSDKNAAAGDAQNSDDAKSESKDGKVDNRKAEAAAGSEDSTSAASVLANSEKTDENEAAIAVCALWEADTAADSLTMTLVANGDVDHPVDTLTLSKKNDWQDAFTDVPVADEKGEAITYNVVPAVAEGFDVDGQAKTVEAQALRQDGESVSADELAKMANAEEDSAEAKAVGAQVAQDNSVSSLDAGGNLSADRPALFAFTYTPATYAAASGDRAAAPTVPLTITKDWSDGNDNHDGESVTVDVHVTYEDDSAWDYTTTISSGDGWKKVVNVPANISIEACTVTERAVNGYDSYVEPVNIDASDVWIPVQPNALKNGETYAVAYQSAYGSSYYVLTDTGYGSLSSDRVTMGANTVIYDGVSYHDYLTSVGDNAQWQWLSVASQGYSGRYVLKNASTSNYVHEKVTSNYSAYSGYYYSYSFEASSTGGMPLVYGSNKTLVSTTGHYLVNYSSSTTSASSATAYTFFKKIRATSKMSTTVHNRRTAAATESSTSVSVKKEWSDGAAKHAKDSVTLHLTDVDKGGQRVSSAAPVTLNAGNGWKADDVWQNLLEGMYSIDEDAIPGYNAKVESTQNRKVIWVPVKNFEDGGIYAVVENSSKAFIESVNQTAGSNATQFGVKSYSSAAKSNPIAKALEFGGKQYKGYLDSADVPISAQWTATQQGTAYGLQAASANGAERGVWLYPQSWSPYYLATGSTSTTSEYKSHSLFTYDGATGYLYDRYLNSQGNRIGEYNGYPSVNNTPAKTFTLYKRITLVDRQFTVVNTPISGASAADDVKVDHNKYLDAFRDGKSNPDTSFASGTDLTDLYRLYLDAGPLDLSQPVDMLLILDDSGSMGYDDYGNVVGANSSSSRTGQLKNILTGSGQVIQKFLAANTKNRVGIVSFSGKGSVYSTDASNDASVLTTSGYYGTTPAWVNSTSSVNTALDKLVASGGTNYCAGLSKAGDLLKLPANGNKRVVVFLSDGVPTFYIDDSGLRHGHGFSDKGNSTSCIEPSISAFDKFKAAYPDATTYSIGFSKDIGGSTSQVTNSPTVLRYYAEQGGGMYIQANDADVLSDQLSKLILGGGLFTNASISDTLSDAVDLYDPQPDYKVVMQKLSNGATVGSPVVLYENGQAKKQYVDDSENGASKDIVTDVSYDPVTRTVTALLDPNYAMDPEYRYTVSFNVKTTDKAYADFAADKAQGGDGYGGMKGDKNTDYTPYQATPANSTSSGKLGFRSNTSAQFNFKRGNSYYAMAYDHPVIQVGDCSFDIKKVDADDANKLLGGAKFSVYRKAENGAFTVNGLEGNYDRVATDLVTQGGVASVKHLEPGTYWVVEDAPPSGYTLDSTPHEIMLTRDSIVVGAGDTTTVFEGNDDGHLVLRITNKAGYSLPKTGGIGNGPFTAAGLALLATSLAFGCVLARRRNERRLGRAYLQRR